MLFTDTGRGCEALVFEDTKAGIACLAEPFATFLGAYLAGTVPAAEAATTALLSLFFVFGAATRSPAPGAALSPGAVLRRTLRSGNVSVDTARTGAVLGCPVLRGNGRWTADSRGVAHRFFGVEVLAGDFLIEESDFI